MDAPPVPLKLQFDWNQYWYDQLERTATSAIYSQFDSEDKLVAYEVVRIRVAPPEQVMGKSYPLREVYPGTNQWGSYGWTCRSLAEARAKAKWIDEETAKVLERAKTGTP
jgi:hypothetical protein